VKRKDSTPQRDEKPLAALDLGAFVDLGYVPFLGKKTPV
jgi:hypothetical protein